jgi:4'-phosphopantetheinyl transferase
MNIFVHEREPGAEKLPTEILVLEALNAYKKGNGLMDSTRQISSENIKRSEKGKPYLEASCIKFSVSHSGNLWICAMGDHEMGIDVQKMRPSKTRELARRFFTEEEYDYIAQTAESDFFRIWTMKEAFVKYIGQGISYGFDKFSVVKEHQLLDGLSEPVPCKFMEVHLGDEYQCYCCARDKEDTWIRKL